MGTGAPQAQQAVLPLHSSSCQQLLGCLVVFLQSADQCGRKTAHTLILTIADCPFVRALPSLSLLPRPSPLKGFAGT